jgi:hypothetical protein
MLFSRFAKSAATLFLLTVGFAAPVHAQQNKQIISGTWYEDQALAVVGSNQMVLTFAETPTNQFLNITNVSCNVEVTSAQVMTAMSLYSGSTSGSADTGRIYEIKGGGTPETIGTLKFYSIVTNQIFYKFGPGRFPSIEMDTTTTGGTPLISTRCVIVGNLTDN